MNLLIFGATGRTGKIVVRKALEQGHHVTVYVRDPSKLEQGPEALTIIQGELMEQDKIEKAVQGQDVVISLLAPHGRIPGKPITKAITRTLRGMEKHDVQRIITVGTPSITEKQDAFDAKYKLIKTGERAFTKEQTDDVIDAAEAVRQSDRDWTIVRVPFLTNKPGNNMVKAGFLGDGNFRTKLSREDLAMFILSQLDNDTYSRQAPLLTQSSEKKITS
ncbi:NAD(P)-dependent oxidoreductase [Salibacterium aidingense]|uniref:NAD(P)-dependent oxidoreductase n=1 Tax=Salibacterium aidingense TaxID=384933 RepID=UPI003BDA9497